MKWYAYYIIHGSPIIIAEFQYMLDAYNWLAKRCKWKRDGFYFKDLRVFFEHRR